MSVSLLQYPQKFHTLQDDIEAFFWVIIYVALRYMFQNNFLEGSLKEDLKYIFHTYRRNSRRQTKGGDGKRTYLADPPRMSNAVLDDFCQQARAYFVEYNKLLGDI